MVAFTLASLLGVPVAIAARRLTDVAGALAARTADDDLLVLLDNSSVASSRDACSSHAIDITMFFHTHTFLVATCYMTVLNLGVQFLQTWVETLLMYPLLDEAQKVATPVRLVQSCLSPLFLLGYVVFIIKAASGCDWSNPYTICIGAVAVAFDFYELIRRWPLRPMLAVHHYATLAISINIIEFTPSVIEGGEPMSPFFVLFLAGLSWQWGTDSFSTVFRLSTSLPLIQKWRLMYLASAVARFAGTGFLIGLGITYARQRVYGSSAIASCMAAAHFAEQCRSLLWVYRFDPRRYFDSHQQLVLDKGKGGP